MLETANKTPLQREDGFPGQQFIALPRSLVDSWLEGDPLLDLLPSDVGFFPSARCHYIKRPEGSPQLVLIYCIAGKGWAQIGETSTGIVPGQVLVIPPNTPHTYSADVDNPWSIYWVHITGSKTESVLRLLALNPLRVSLFPGLDPALPALFERIIQTLSSGYLANNLLSTGTSLHRMLTHLIEAPPLQQEEKLSHDTKINKVISKMSQSLHKNLSLKELAQNAAMSTSHFAAIFKKQTGFSPLDYFTRLKMEKARHLLNTTNLPVKEIAAQLGFDDPLYFSRRFRRIHNCSPTQYLTVGTLQ